MPPVGTGRSSACEAARRRGPVLHVGHKGRQWPPHLLRHRPRTVAPRARKIERGRVAHPCRLAEPKRREFGKFVGRIGSQQTETGHGHHFGQGRWTVHLLGQGDGAAGQIGGTLQVGVVHLGREGGQQTSSANSNARPRSRPRPARGAPPDRPPPSPFRRPNLAPHAELP